MRSSRRRSPQPRSTFLADLAPGQVRKGVISSIVNFGAFVDLGGVDGLVHVSELSWKHIEHASEVVEVGQEVTVEVLSVELDRERVSLSLKATQEDPWQVFARTHADRSDRARVRSPSSFRSVRSFALQTASRASCTSPSCRASTLSSPSRLSRSARRCSSRSSTSTWIAAASRCSLKQANDGVDPEGTEFDPALYGMTTEYDEAGEYKYPEGFDPETQEWKEGFETQREKWEQEYAAAQARWEAHKKQVAATAAAEHANAPEISGETAGSYLLQRLRFRRAPSPTTQLSPS